jgi:transposase
VEQFEGIRRDSRDQGLSIRALAKRHGVHRRTVRQALADATPPARRAPERLAPATGPYVDLVRRWLMEDQAAPKKQRHTARRIWQRLVEEEEARIGESTVRNLVARLRIEIAADRCQVMVPQTHPPAAEAEVDFGEFAASIAGQVMKLYMFCMRLSHSGKAFHVGYAAGAAKWGQLVLRHLPGMQCSFSRPRRRRARTRRWSVPWWLRRDGRRRRGARSRTRAMHPRR